MFILLTLLNRMSWIESFRIDTDVLLQDDKDDVMSSVDSPKSPQETTTLLSLLEEEDDDSSSSSSTHEHSGGGGGGLDSNRCITQVQTLRETWLEDGIGQDRIPEQLETWCYEVGHVLAGDDPKGKAVETEWKRACQKARSALEASLKQGDPFKPHRFCTTLIDDIRQAVDRTKLYTFGDEEDGNAPYLTPLATPPCKLNHLKQPRPCCSAHGLKGCHDSVIEECVCGRDSSCCKDSWNLRCAELVEKITIKNVAEIQRCGRCPRQIFDPKELEKCQRSVMPN